MAILYPLSDLETTTINFTKELEDASSGEKTSLSFSKNPLPTQPLVEKGEQFQIIVLGGTNFQTARARQTSRGIEITAQHSGRSPLFQSFDALVDFFIQHLDPLVKTVALNFAFPLAPTLRDNRLDAQLIQATKGYSFAGIEERLLGSELEKAVWGENHQQIKISLANDLTCLALAEVKITNRLNLAALIVGTGYNCGFFLDEETFINTEAGNFDHFPQTDTGRRVDQASYDPGAYLFQKELSGAYLYQHFNLLTGQKIEASTQLTEIAKGQGDAAKLAADLFQRSASLVACQLAGIYHFLKRDQLTFIAEGGVFWQVPHYQEWVSDYLSQLQLPAGSVVFEEVKNSSLIGAAHLVV